MMALIIVSCALSGQDCRPSMQADGLQMMECIVQSQRIAAQYKAEHPKRKVTRVICADRRRVAFYLGRHQA